MKRIDPERIKSIKASINASTNEIPDDIRSLIDAPVTGNFEDCVKRTKATMESLVTTVDSLDQYLDSVADAFAATEAALAAAIDGGIYIKAPESRAERRERYIQGGKDSKERHNRRKMVEIAESQYKDFP
ncbi:MULTISPECIES: hypothetical protein [Streptococcus]|uniref:Phage protein n=1 Tax=Streptococcus oralis TaxID=1303 RepID=A0AAW7W9G2_STROR|nr:MULTISPECIES: hypothetical protein [Streptococcus]ANR74753.1 hypothetical protein AXF18_01865 [Streptococcus sp. oral taxon 064]MDO6344227.1 hypothetical protein [Streptococcus oralis]MDO6348134.1 hypothetical protein [Streptococcus oralis]MDO6350143.1 hypothetical protein [Streptococcus oralis]